MILTINFLKSKKRTQHYNFTFSQIFIPSMETLIELAQIVSKNKTKRIDIVGNPNNYNSNLQRLYDGLLSGKIKNETDAVEQFFPTTSDGQKNFKRLKRRLFQRLTNTLFFIDVNRPTFTDMQKAYYACYKDFAAVKILIGRAGRRSSTKLAEQVLRKAFEFEFTDITVDILRALRMQYATLSGNEKDFQRVKKLFEQQKAFLQAEDAAEDYYTEIAIHFVNSRASKFELAERAKEFSNALFELEKTCNTRRFIVISYLVHSLRFQIQNDYKGTLTVCERAIEKLKEKNLDVLSNTRTFLMKMGVANIQLGNYEAGKQNIEACLEGTEAGTPNWYIQKFYYLLLMFRCEKYQKALPTFMEASKHPKFQKQTDALKEQWTIAEAYVHYLVECGKIKLSFQEEKAMGKFRVGKFLNQVTVYSKDKRGANISILILQILFLLKQKKYEETNDRLDAIMAYSYKYLKKNDTFRSNCFIHMLLQLPKSYFNRKVAARKTQKYLDKLKSVPLEVAGQSSELEMVPYEKLWEMVLASLKG